MYVARSETDPEACGKIIEVSRDDLESAGDDFSVKDHEIFIERAYDAWIEQEGIDTTKDPFQ